MKERGKLEKKSFFFFFFSLFFFSYNDIMNNAVDNECDIKAGSAAYSWAGIERWIFQPKIMIKTISIKRTFLSSDEW